jgi:autotransporter-associated beta strand protein
MKPTSNRSLRSAALAGFCLALGATAHAANYWFDNNGTTAGFGLTNGATYDWTTALSWNTDAAGGAGTMTTWPGGSNQAFFAGAGASTSYTIRLGATGSTDVTLQNFALNVNSALSGASGNGNVTIGNTGDTGKLILSAANSIGAHNGTLTVNNAVDLNAKTLNFRGGSVVINGVVSGTGASNIASGSGTYGLSSGTLTLAGNNTFAGSTSVASGYIFNLQHANALGAAGGTNTVSSGGAMEVAGGAIINSGESITINGAGISSTSIGALRAGTGGGTWAGTVTIGDSSARLGATTGNALTVTGSIVNGSGSALTISGQAGTGVVILNPSASNTYTGNTNIIRGILRLGKNDALPTGTILDVDSAAGVADAATFDLASFNQTVAALQDTATTSVNGIVTNSVTSTTSTLTLNQASNTDFGGVIQNGSGLVVLTKDGVGDLTLSGANTYTGGTNIRNGSVIIAGGDNRLAVGGSVVLGDVATSGKLIVGTSSVARSQTLAGLTTTGLGGSVVGAHASTNSVLTLNIASGTNTFAGTLGGGGTNENILALAKTGNGTLNLTGANTYSGPTTLTTGTAQLGMDSVGTVGSITSSAIGTGTLTFNGGTLSSDGGAARTILNAVTFTGNAGMGDATNNGKLTFSANLDLGGTARSITVNSEVQIDGSFTNSAASAGLTKTGAGTLIINAANTSFGTGNGFAITGGTVVAAHTAAMGNAGQIVTLSSGSSFGTLDLATDTTANAYVLNFGSVAGAGGNVIVNRATSGAAITHTLGVATFGNTKMNVVAGANITSGTPTLELAGMNLSAGVTGDGATTLNPTTANILISGAITRTGVLSNSLVLDGTNSGNLISGVISGSQALTKSNTSTWELSNANTFNGKTLVTGGTLKLTNNLALQSSAFDTSGAGTLDFSTLNTPTFGGLIGDAITGQDLVLHAGVTSLTLNVGAGVTQTYVKNISGGAAGLTLTKMGSSTQVLGGTNSYSGLTTVGTAGELQITSAGAIGGTDVTVESGGQLTLNGGITVTGKTVTTSGSGRAAGTGSFLGGLQSVSGTNEWAGSVLLGANLSRVGARKDATLVISGAIDDGIETFGLVIRNESFGSGRNGAGNANTIVVLSGASTYGGITQLVHGLTKLDGGDNRLPVGTFLQFGLGTTNAKFDMNGRNQEVAGLAVTSTSTDSNRDWNANELTNSSGTLSTLTVNTTADQTFGGNLANNVGIITGNIALVKSGSAKLTLSGPNTYTGDTTVSAGTLAISGGGSIANSANIKVDGTLDVSGLTAGTFTVGALQTLSGDGTIDATAKTLEIAGTHAVGNSPGQQDVIGNLSYTSTSIFEWDLAANVDGAGGSRGNDFDAVDVTGDLTIDSSATFKVIQNAGVNFGSSFWDTNQTWANIWNITGTLNGGWSNAAVSVYNTSNVLQDVSAEGYFTLNASTLTWTAVPEPTSALVGLLIGTGLLRRRRQHGISKVH